MYTGHIRARKSKDGKTTSYQLIFEGEKCPLTGARQRLYESYKGTKKDAEMLLINRLHDLNNGIAFSKPSAMKLSDWLAEYMKLYTSKLSPTTRASYEERISKRIDPYLGSIPIGALTAKQVQEWVEELQDEEGLKPKTVKNLYHILNTALKKAQTVHKIKNNPCDGIELPEVEKPDIEVFDESEVERLLRVTKGTDMYLMAVLELSLGIRRGELNALRWEDVDFVNNVIHIRRSRSMAGKEKVTKAPKTKAGVRDLYLGDNVAELLKNEYTKYCEDVQKPGFTDSGYIIHKKDGTQFSPDSITQKWIRFRRKHGFKEVKFHGLRHTCATMMVAQNVDNKTVQVRMGHSDIRTTLNTYAHCLPSMNKAAGDKLDTMFDNN